MMHMDIIKKINKEKGKLIIAGAGIVGEVLFRACEKAGIKVECFCDNNINKTGKRLLGLEVVYAPSLKSRHPDAFFLISASDIRDIVEQLEGMGYPRWYACNELLRDFDIYKYDYEVPVDFVEYAVSTAILCHDSYLTPNKLFLRSVDIIVTERCSMKCRDCSNLTQYYKNPADCDVKSLIRTIDRFCSIIDEVNEFRVLGAEPFMNRDVHVVIRRLSEEPKVKRVVIYTNGTIIPREDQLPSLKSKKVLFIITDYGALSRNLAGLVRLLKHHGISHLVRKAGGWTDCGKIVKHNRSIEQQKEVFRSCCAKNTITLSDEKLCRCPFSGNAVRLCAVPDNPEDYIDIFKGTTKEAKTRIREFITKKEYLEACDYCNGRPFDAPEITPAVQVDKPIVYKKHC